MRHHPGNVKNEIRTSDFEVRLPYSVSRTFKIVSLGAEVGPIACMKARVGDFVRVSVDFTPQSGDAVHFVSPLVSLSFRGYVGPGRGGGAV